MSAPQALRDRMEVLPLAGYTEQEKVEIAKRFLVLKAVAGTGLTNQNITFTDEAIQTMIQRYTREAGVRNLEREISSICRKVARQGGVDGNSVGEGITADNVTQYAREVTHAFIRALVWHSACRRTVRYEGGVAPSTTRLSKAANRSNALTPPA